MVRVVWGRIALAIAVMLAALAPAVRAGEGSARREAMRHYEGGNKLYADSDFLGAREEFLAARALVDAPELLFNLAQCARNLGDHDEALDLYRQFLERKPDAPNRARVEEFIAAEEALLAAADRSPAPAMPPTEAKAKEAPPKATLPSADKAGGEQPKIPPNGEQPKIVPNGEQPKIAPPVEQVKVEPPVVSVPPSPVPPQMLPVPLPPTRIWKRPWLWIAAGSTAVVAIGLGVGLGVGLSGTQGSSLGVRDLGLGF